MSWKDYEMLDATREMATEEELHKLRKKYNLVEEAQRQNGLMHTRRQSRVEILEEKEI